MVRVDFLKQMTILHGAMGLSLDENRMNIYYDLLKDYTLEDFSKAIFAIARERKYTNLPLVADFVQEIEGDVSSEAVLEWQTVIKSMEQFGSNSSISFENKTVQVIIENLGGWVELCTKDYKELKFLEKDFVVQYKIYKKNGMNPRRKHLIGRYEMANAHQGYAIAPPWIIKSMIGVKRKEITA